jgi:DNA-binding transcriptional ArsR family regulator
LTSLHRQTADLDRVIHEPARLTIMALLAAVDEADFLYLLRESGLTKGNLGSHLVKLEEAGYVEIEKGFVGKIPRTVCRLTKGGREAFKTYRSKLRKIASSLGASTRTPGDGRSGR